MTKLKINRSSLQFTQKKNKNKKEIQLKVQKRPKFVLKCGGGSRTFQQRGQSESEKKIQFILTPNKNVSRRE
jgi:hypothetical protein